MEAEVIDALLKTRSVIINSREPFRWASGILSPIYTDNRLLLSYPEERKKIMDAFTRAAQKLEFDIIAGVATSGIPWAAWLAERLSRPLVYARSDTKDHGRKNLVEGRVEKGTRALVIEDLVSTGGSSVAAVEAVRSTGAVVTDCIAIFTYGLKAAEERFRNAGCRLHTLTNFSELIVSAAARGYLDREETARLSDWIKDPENWSANHVD